MGNSLSLASILRSTALHILPHSQTFPTVLPPIILTL